MKVVIIGCGKVGINLSYGLSNEGHDVTVIDCKETSLVRLKDAQDIMCIEGNGADVEIQQEAQVEKAGLFIATTPHDELNLLCCLIAKKLGARKTISRVRNPIYFNQIELIRDELGLSMAMNPERIASDEIMRILLFPAAVKIEVFSKGRIQLVEHVISENSSICNIKLLDIYKLYKVKFLICTVERGSEIFIPDGNFELHAGDKINIAASPRNIQNFFKSTSLIRNKVKTVMIVGGGKICNYLVKQILDMKIRVKIIENDYKKCCELSEAFPKATVIYADGTEQEVLIEEGLNDVDAFVAMTGMDEENILISLFAKNNSNAKIITKINRESYCDMAAEMGVDCIVSPKSLAETTVASYVRSLSNTKGSSNIESLYYIVGNKAEAIEFKIKSDIDRLIDIPLKDLKLKKNILICGIIREKQVIIPHGNDCIKKNDSVIVVLKDYRFDRIEDILE